MDFLPQIIFAILLLAAIAFFLKSAKRIIGNINLGKSFDRSDQKNIRWRNVILLALGQKKMFKRPVPAALHFLVYAGFLIVNLELLEIVLDGLLGTHRIFESALGNFYTPLINFFELFAAAVLVSCVIFLIRRNVLKIGRFQKKEMTSWPKLDGNLILVFEVVLMIFLLSMNATDTLIREGKGIAQSYWVSDLLKPLYAGISPDGLVLTERIFWWSHVIGIFFFANYVPYSKHLHIFLAFPNSYYASLEENGKMENMPAVTNEVQLMLGMATPDASAPPAEISRFGAKDVVDLSKKNILDAFTCTECGRCTDNCPANLTGKELSPRKIMMDVRDRADELGEFRRKEGNDKDDGRSLLGDFISDEEIQACTSCNACVEACPVSINPLDIILEMRRYKVMEESQGPAEWMGMYGNIETSFNPWKFPPTDRGNWTSDLTDNSKNETNEAQA